jgi:uncharacterized membrane protein
MVSPLEYPMSHASDRTFNSDFRRFFLRGLVVLLPTVLTLWLVVKAYQFVDNSFAEPINQGVRLGIVRATPHLDRLEQSFEPTLEAVEAEESKLRLAGTKPPEANVIRSRLRRENVRAWWDAHWYMDFIGLVVAIVAVYIAGRLLGGFFGRRIYRKIEQVITSLPVFKQVYPYIKQIVDFLFNDDKAMQFNRVVVVEYPRKGIWSVGFQTGGAMRAVAEQSGESVTVFIPSSPTPFTGYTITVPASEVRELPISVEEALRFAVSGGVLVPEHQSIENGEPTKPLAMTDGSPPRSTEQDVTMDEANQESDDEDQRRNVG